MGCFCSKSEWKSYEDYIDRACKRSLLASKHCEKITKSIHRTTLHFHLTKTQLKDSLSYLKLDLTEELDRIFAHFLEQPKECKLIEQQNLRSEYKKDYTTAMYSVKKLSTFGILVGQGSIQEKSKSLFSVYDIDASNNLSKWEISLMIKEVLDISLNRIPNIAMMLYPELEESLVGYKAKLMKMKQNYLDYFKYLLLEDKVLELTGEEFVKAMERADMKGILSPQHLRVMIFKNFLKCVEIHDENKKELEKFKNNSNEGTPQILNFQEPLLETSK